MTLDYDHADGWGYEVPPLPEGWTDSTWHNDAMPSYEVGDCASGSTTPTPPSATARLTASPSAPSTTAFRATTCWPPTTGPRSSPFVTANLPQHPGDPDAH